MDQGIPTDDELFKGQLSNLLNRMGLEVLILGINVQDIWKHTTPPTNPDLLSALSQLAPAHLSIAHRYFEIYDLLADRFLINDDESMISHIRDIEKREGIVGLEDYNQMASRIRAFIERHDGKLDNGMSTREMEMMRVFIETAKDLLAEIDNQANVLEKPKE